MHCLYTYYVQGACAEHADTANSTDLLDSLDLSLSHSQLINLKLNNSSSSKHHKQSTATTSVLRESQDDASILRASLKNFKKFNGNTSAKRGGDVTPHRDSQSVNAQQQLPAVAVAALKHPTPALVSSQQLAAAHKQVTRYCIVL
jgi:hypothetical protein